jgi:hypothetical protein
METALVRPNQASSMIAFFSVSLKFVYRQKLVFWYSDNSLVGLGLNKGLSYTVI